MVLNEDSEEKEEGELKIDATFWKYEQAKKMQTVW